MQNSQGELSRAVEACRSDRSGRPHEICFEVTQAAGYIYLNVSDNGIGMDAATRANVFTFFFSSNRNYDGFVKSCVTPFDGAG